MTDLRTAAQQALEALEEYQSKGAPFLACDGAAAALRAALAQQDEPVQEPVAYIHRQGNHWEVSERFLLDDEKARGWTEEPLYLAPPQCKPLTDEEIDAEWRELDGEASALFKRVIRKFARAIERAHGIGEQP